MSELSNKIDQVRDILRTDDGISGAMDYTQAISWVLFLKFLDDFENSLNDEAFLENRTYNYVIDEEHGQYCTLTLDEQAKIISAASGDRGPNDEYLYSTRNKIAELGINDTEIEWLYTRVMSIKNQKR